MESRGLLESCRNVTVNLNREPYSESSSVSALKHERF